MKLKHHKFSHRVVLYAADVAAITGRTERSARRLLRKIRIALGKSENEFITAREFCRFYGIDEQSVKDFLGGNN